MRRRVAERRWWCRRRLRRRCGGLSEEREKKRERKRGRVVVSGRAGEGRVRRRWERGPRRPGGAQHGTQGRTVGAWVPGRERGRANYRRRGCERARGDEPVRLCARTVSFGEIGQGWCVP